MPGSGSTRDLARHKIRRPFKPRYSAASRFPALFEQRFLVDGIEELVGLDRETGRYMFASCVAVPNNTRTAKTAGNPRFRL